VLTQAAGTAFREQWLLLDGKARACVPEFLIVSPPRTGSTWLAETLGRHPDLFVANAPKEIKYFSNRWRTRGLRWYLEHFGEANGRIKGEATPSYSILPARTIEAIKALAPDLKLIYLMRDPIDRAWSHAKHVFTYREATFRHHDGPFEGVSEAQFLDTFTHEWALSQGDYLGTLQRWRAVFPRTQIHVGFFESIPREPERLLGDLCRFLGVAGEGWKGIALDRVVNAGRVETLAPSLRAALWAIYHERTVDLVEYLRREFDLVAPPEWAQSLSPDPPDGADAVSASLPGLSETLPALAASLDDAALERILAQDDEESTTDLAADRRPGFARVINRGVRVSVILPYFAKASTVFACLDRLRRQSLGLCARDEVEIILIDDGTEGEDLRSRLPDDVIYLWQRKRLFGAGRARNTGAKIANGTYLVFLDPDCLVTETFIDGVLRGFARFGDRVVQTGYISDYYFPGSPDPRTEFGVWNIQDGVSARFFQLAGGNMALGRALFFEADGFDEALIYSGVEDLIFGYRLGQLPRTAMYFNRDMLATHLPHPPSPAHGSPAASWAVIKLKYPEFYDAYIVKGLR
jgi:hypothetical protein